jgi:NLR family CARD domain-containing protein 3
VALSWLDCDVALFQINLSRRGISVNEALLLKDTIETNQQLYVLRLPYNQLGDEGAAIIAAALSNAGTQHHQLSVLDLGFNSIGDAGAGSIAVHCVAANPHLQCLYLSGNNIQEKGAMSIAGGILHGSSIKKLSMAGNRLRPNSIKTLVAAISQNDARIQTLRAHSDNPNDEKFKVFETIDFSYTAMMSEGFPSLPGMILSNSSLKSLNVSGNYLNDNDLLLLSQALTQNKCVPLETIDFSFNHITCVGVEGLMNAVWGSETLRHLNLCKTRIKDRGTQLCAVVLTSIKLETLNIGFNKITALGVKTLMKNVSENDSLESLTLSGIQMDQSSAKAISFALAHCHSLRQVHLDSSLDGFALQRHIVAGIVSNRLSKLHVLTGFNIGRKWQS